MHPDRQHLRFQGRGEDLIVPVAGDAAMVDVTIRISRDAMRFLTGGTGLIGSSGALVEDLIRERQDRLMRGELATASLQGDSHAA